MKFRITMKTPDAAEHVIGDIVDAYINDMKETVGIRDEEEEEELRMSKENSMYDVLEKFMSHHETVTLEFDTVHRTCSVLEVAK